MYLLHLLAEPKAPESQDLRLSGPLVRGFHRLAFFHPLSWVIDYDHKMGSFGHFFNDRIIVGPLIIRSVFFSFCRLNEVKRSTFSFCVERFEFE